MGADGFERLSCSPGIPDVKPAVMSRGQDEWILAIVLDLCGAGKPIAEGEHRLPRSAEIPTVNISIHCARGKRVGVVSREVDVSDGSAVGLEGMLDGTRRRIVPLVKVPHQTAMVCRGSNPVVASREG
jgi:hypothetical protein